MPNVAADLAASAFDSNEPSQMGVETPQFLDLIKLHVAQPYDACAWLSLGLMYICMQIS